MKNPLKKGRSTKKKLVAILIVCSGLLPAFAWSACNTTNAKGLVGYNGTVTVHSAIPQVYPGSSSQASDYIGSATITCSGSHTIDILGNIRDDGGISRWLNTYPGADRAEAKYTINILSDNRTININNVYNFKTGRLDSGTGIRRNQPGRVIYTITARSNAEDHIVRSSQYYEQPGPLPVSNSTFMIITENGFAYNSRFAVGAVPRPNYCFEPSSYNVYITSPDESSETRGNQEASVNMEFFIRGTAKNPVIEKPFRIGVALRNNSQCHRSVTPNIRFTSSTTLEPRYKGSHMGVKISLLDSSNRVVVLNRRYNFGQLSHIQTGADNAKYLNFKIRAEKIRELLPGDFSGSFRFIIEYP